MFLDLDVRLTETLVQLNCNVITRNTSTSEVNHYRKFLVTDLTVKQQNLEE